MHRAICRNSLGSAMALTLACGVASFLFTPQAQASESGTSIYLLGSGGPGAAVLPPIRGVFLSNTAYYYDASAKADKAFPIGGNVVAGLDVKVVADFATVLWVPTTDLGGATLVVGASLPFGEPSADVSVVLTGPRGGQVGREIEDSNFVVGDPLVTAMLGWKLGKKVSLSTSGFLNIPVGDYREGALANLAFHRWAGDASIAATWLDPELGWDISGKIGMTVNGENEATLYKTGTELHLEGAIEKTFSKRWSAGVQAYYFDQLSGDSGPGATLGAFKGRVTGIGATGAYNFELGARPASLRLHAFKEFDAKNRLEGSSVFLDFTIPLHMVLPGAAAGS